MILDKLKTQNKKMSLGREMDLVMLASKIDLELTLSTQGKTKFSLGSFITTFSYSLA